MKKAQVTIFVIIAVLIVAAVVLFFIFRSKLPIIGGSSKMPNIQAELDKCVRDNTLQAIDIMLPQAGYISPQNYVLYQDNKVEYLCYNQNLYASCVNQEPMYMEHLKEEIKNYLTGKVKDCLYNIEKNYKDKGYDIDSGNMNIEVGLYPKNVKVVINKNMEIKKNDETKNYQSFKYNIPSPLYDMAIIAIEIANQEAKFCYFEYLGYSIVYNRFTIDKKNLGEDSDIYVIKEKDSGKEMLIGIRSCALPGGI